MVEFPQTGGIYRGFIGIYCILDISDLGFPQNRDTFVLEGPITRIREFWCLHWGSPNSWKLPYEGFPT